MGKLLVIPLAMVLLLAGAMAWSGGGPGERADFTFINRGEITTLDPARISWLQDLRISYAIWEGLYTLDPVTSAPVPGAAASHELSPDKTRYTFRLRPDARWSNGDPVTAGDFVFAWRRMLRMPDEYTAMFHYIAGARDYQEAYAADPAAGFDGVGVKAVDDRTLEVQLKHPVAFFLDLVAFTPFFPQHEPSMRPFARTEGGRTTYDERFTHPPHLVGNGPYVLDKWEFKRRIRLVASDTYWNRASLRNRVVEQISADDPQTAYLKFHAGGVDWLSDTIPPIAAELKARNDPNLVTFPGFGTYFYSVNCTPTLPDGSSNPFQDVRVRRAFAMAVDKRPVVENVTRTGERIATTYIPPGIFRGYDSPPGVAHDPTAARELLAAAGFPGGRGFPKVTLLFNTGAHHGDVAQVVRRQWLEVLGVDVGLEGVEVQVFRSRLNKKQYAIARASWIGDYPDPSTFTDKYRSFSDGNDAGWKNEEYDRLCAAAATEPDPAERLAMLAWAEGLMVAESPIIPMYYYNNAYLMRPEVKGVPLEPRQLTMFNLMRVEADGR
ncbi:MAG TPA: peptide ABC transporter substrate-binding protein [Tepidisphaeraceae bacterium]|nr:peptide ABC transporter substrate-binding protein [Tepidisphaeraceae bacterium]